MRCVPHRVADVLRLTAERKASIVCSRKRFRRSRLSITPVDIIQRPSLTLRVTMYDSPELCVVLNVFNPKAKDPATIIVALSTSYQYRCEQ